MATILRSRRLQARHVSAHEETPGVHGADGRPARRR